MDLQYINAWRKCRAQGIKVETEYEDSNNELRECDADLGDYKACPFKIGNLCAQFAFELGVEFARLVYSKE